MSGQGEARTTGFRRRLARAAAGVLLMSAAGGALAADRPTPSGLPVPRYVSLKFSEVNARVGPGDDYRRLWIYHARGLPVQVVAETTEWRRVCDPEGGLAWVHRRTTDGQRMVMRTQASAAPLRRSPHAQQRPAAFLAPGALAQLDRCNADGWCRIKVDGFTGWAPAGSLWGVDERAQCR